MLDYGEYITDDYYEQGNGYHNGYDQLEGDWALYYKVARYFVRKVKREDRQDFLHALAPGDDGAWKNGIQRDNGNERR